MSPRDTAAFLALAALWGASFLFMRVAAPVFGPVPLMLLRCAIGALTLAPLLVLFGRPADLGAHLPRIALVGVLNSAAPFVLLGYATLALSAGVTSIMNSLAPLWSAAVAFLWLGDRLTRWQALGLGLGVAGVVVLAGGGAGHDPAATGAAGAAPPFLAALAATAFYGLAANVARRTLAGVDPLALATGSQLSATLALLVPGLALWPEGAAPGAADWGAVIALGTLCTGLAYLLFFHLIGSVGATRTIAVTFAIPVFGVGWGAWLLGERVDGATLAGGAVVVLGTALATGVLAPRRRVRGRA